MNAKAYTEGLAKLREVRDEIRPLERQLAKIQAELDKLQAKRDQKIVELREFEKAKADPLATSAGVSVIDVVVLVPSLGPQEPVSAPVEATSAGDSVAEDRPRPQAAVQAIKEPVGAPAPDLRSQNRESDDRAAALTRLPEATADGAFDLDVLDKPTPATAAAPPPHRQLRRPWRLTGSRRGRCRRFPRVQLVTAGSTPSRT
ncbi:hypothetical protein [Streptomyces sp. NPDC048350]|uniref:hypothetical protein n=1 Tax=Streptomyces sp. NPDC048350 TaxID=3365538 RepID=UPI00371DBBF5